MNYIYYIGIDMSKDFFDVACSDMPRQAKRFGNDAIGFAEFGKAYGERLASGLAVVEATGGYEKALLAYLLGNGYAAHRADPLKAKHFIRSLGQNGKTDRLDAHALARYALERHASLPLYRKENEKHEKLKLLVLRSADLKEMLVKEKNRSKHPGYKSLAASTRRMIDQLNNEISLICEEIEELVAAEKELADKEKILTEVKGIGKHTAHSLIALMPELGTLTRRKAASLAGLAPHPKDSGKSSGYRAVRGGRHPVRTALFMAAMVAMRYDQTLKAFHQNLIHKGKKPMVALTAVMRKLITILNAKLRDKFFMQAA